MSSSLRLVVSATVLIVLANVPALAQEPPNPEKAMAGIIRSALAPSNLGDWRCDWTAVSSRVSSLMHWHVYGRDAPEENELVRRGWVSAAGRSIGVEAWGSDTAVTNLSFEYNSWPQFGDEDPHLIAALAAEGVTAAEIERRASPKFFHSEEPVIVYRLTAAGLDPARLTLSTQCTSPQSAASQRCTISYTLELGG